jgi:hypothetical protein
MAETRGDQQEQESDNILSHDHNRSTPTESTGTTAQSLSTSNLRRHKACTNREVTFQGLTHTPATNNRNLYRHPCKAKRWSLGVGRSWHLATEERLFAWGPKNTEGDIQPYPQTPKGTGIHLPL